MSVLKKYKPNKYNLNPDDFKNKKEYDKEYNRLSYIERKSNKRKKRHSRIYGKLYKLKTNYNLHIEEYKKLMNLANYSCEICNMTNKEHIEKHKRPLFVDHNHNNNDIRGILCNYCNMIEGYLLNNNISIDKYLYNFNNYMNKDSAYIKALNIWRKNGRKQKVTKLFRRYKKNAT